MPFRKVAWISGAICGDTWMPQVLCGKGINIDLHREMKRFSEPASFRDVLLHILMEQGGDFQNPEFTADTVIRIEHTYPEPKGWKVRVKEIELSRIDCEDLTCEHESCEF